MSNGSTNGHVDYDAVLADLQAKRDQIDAAIAAINLIKGAGGGASFVSGNTGTVVAPNAFFTMGIGEAARKYLEMVKGKQTVAQIARALEQGGMPPLKINTVYAALRRREAVNRDIIRLGEEWGLKEWYSNVALPKTRMFKPKLKAKPKTSTDKPKATSGSSQTKSIRMVDAVEKILTDAGKALHANDLVEGLKKFGRNTNINSIRGSLPQDSKKRFVNVGQNTWGLAVWTTRPTGAAKA